MLFKVMAPDMEKILQACRIYNTKFFPFSVIVPLVFAVGAVTLLLMAFKHKNAKSSAYFKIWMALVYTVFGFVLVDSLFPIDRSLGMNGAAAMWFLAALLLLDALWWKKMIFSFPKQKDLRILSILLMVNGIIFYPIIELLTGLSWPGMVLFGAECPTGTFLVGAMLTSLPGKTTNKWLFGIMATTATIMGAYGAYLGIGADFFTYFPAGVIGWAMLARYWDRD